MPPPHPARSEAHSVLVAVRVRPFGRGEDASESTISTSGDSCTLNITEPTTGGSGSSGFVGGASGPQQARHAFVFDRVFAPRVCQRGLSLASPPSVDDDQAAVFSFLGPLLCKHVLDGFNSCLFAYGQTGSGKTYSMIGRQQHASPVDALLASSTSSSTPRLGYAAAAPGTPAGGSAASAPPVHAAAAMQATLPDDAGMIPRLCVALFAAMKRERDAEPNVTHRVECSFVEIYCEKVRDLLVGPGGGGTPAGTPPSSLRVRQHPARGPYVEGSQLVSVSDEAAVMRLLHQGMRERATAETKMNDLSSRSHAILQLQVARVEVVRDAASNGAAGSVVTKSRTSKVNLVDLAGSERVNQSGATGDRLEEAKNINLSLHSLGRVIQVLADRAAPPPKGDQGTATCSSAPPASPPAAQPGAAVPAYRDSILTWLLSDSLGGNSKTVMLATVTPSSANYSQTLNTLRFACIAKRVVNVASVNEDAQAHQLVSELREQILRLTVRLEAKESTSALALAHKSAAEAEATIASQQQVAVDLRSRIAELEAQVREQQEYISSQSGIVEQLSRARLELHHARVALAERDESIAALQRRLDCPDRVDSPSSWSDTSSPTAQLLPPKTPAMLSVEVSAWEELKEHDAELRRQLDDALQQLQVMSQKRQEADVGKIEAHARMDRAIADLKKSDNIQKKLVADLSAVTHELEALRAVSAKSITLASQDRNEQLNKSLAVQAELRDSLETAAARVAKQDDQLQKLEIDVHDLEQLLLEETETSQRHLLLAHAEAQATHLTRAMCQSLLEKSLADVRHQFHSEAAAARHRREVHRAELEARTTLWVDFFCGVERYLITRDFFAGRAAITSLHERKTLAADHAKQIAESRDLRAEVHSLKASLQKLYIAKEAAVSSETERLTEENKRLYVLASESQTAAEASRAEAEQLKAALQQFENAQNDRLLEVELDDLRGTVSELEKENKFVHDANTDVTSRYEAIVRRLRDESRRLREELESEAADRDRAVRALTSQQRQQREEWEDERIRHEEDMHQLRVELAAAKRALHTLTDEAAALRSQRSLASESAMEISVRSGRSPLHEHANSNAMSAVSATKQTERSEHVHYTLDATR